MMWGICRFSLAFVCSGFIGLTMPVIAQEDAVRKKLTSAKETYAKNMKNISQAVADLCDKREEAARKAGDKKTVDQIKAERKAFEDTHELPQGSPLILKQSYATARSAMESAYTEALKTYTRTKQDDDAAAVEKEYAEFKAVGLEARTRLSLAGMWRLSIGDAGYVWTFKEDGTVISTAERLVALGPSRIRRIGCS